MFIIFRERQLPNICFHHIRIVALLQKVNKIPNHTERTRSMGDNKPAGIVAAASKFHKHCCSVVYAFVSLTLSIYVSENRLQVARGLEDVEVSECESCSFEVTLNLAFIEGVWTRDGMQLKSRPSCRISTHGKKHSLILKRVALGDAGLFSFQANGVQTSCRLTVRGTTDCVTSTPSV